MYFSQKGYSNTPEFLASDKYVNFTGTLVGSSVVADDDGNKYVPAGSLIDADGEVVTVSGGPGAYVASATPVGILFHTTDVEEGPQPVALTVEGYVIAERLQGENVAEYAQTADFKAALPEIKVR